MKKNAFKTLHGQVLLFCYNLLFFFVKKLFWQSYMEILGYSAEIVWGDGLELAGCHGHYFYQDFCGFLYCVEKTEGQVKILA